MARSFDRAQWPLSHRCPPRHMAHGEVTRSLQPCLR